MAYNVQNFEDGQVLYAENLNKIESYIADNEIEKDNILTALNNKLEEAGVEERGRTIEEAVDLLPVGGGEGGDGVGKKTASGGEIFNAAVNAGMNAHAEGAGTNATGNQAHAEGAGSQATGENAHAEGGGTQATAACAHAEGTGSRATGSGAHAEGASGASGDNSHAEGGGTTASGVCAHSEGSSTNAIGNSAHAEGTDTTASGDYSHAGGQGTKAASKHQTVIGKYNVEDTTNQYAFIIGDGTSNSNRHNLFAVGWDGKVYVNGTAIN